MKRRSVDAPVKRCNRVNISKGRKGGGRPKNNLDEVFREDLKVVGLMENMD